MIYVLKPAGGKMPGRGDSFIFSSDKFQLYVCVELYFSLSCHHRFGKINSKNCHLGVIISIWGKILKKCYIACNPDKGQTNTNT